MLILLYLFYNFHLLLWNPYKLREFILIFIIVYSMDYNQKGRNLFFIYKTVIHQN